MNEEAPYSPTSPPFLSPRSPPTFLPTTPPYSEEPLTKNCVDKINLTETIEPFSFSSSSSFVKTEDETTTTYIVPDGKKNYNVKYTVNLESPTSKKKYVPPKCKYYLQNRCKYGEDCKFFHPFSFDGRNTKKKMQN